MTIACGDIIGAFLSLLNNPLDPFGMVRLLLDPLAPTYYLRFAFDMAAWACVI